MSLFEKMCKKVYIYCTFLLISELINVQTAKQGLYFGCNNSPQWPYRPIALGHILIKESTHPIALSSHENQLGE